MVYYTIRASELRVGEPAWLWTLLCSVQGDRAHFAIQTTAGTRPWDPADH
jgi:hypothetical protein